MRIGDFTGVGLPRPVTAAACGHACVVRHSGRVLPQSISRGMRKLVGMLVCAGVVGAYWRLAGEVAALLSPARGVAV